MFHATPLLLTDHQQGTHDLDHHTVVLRMSSDGLREMTGIPAVDVAGKPERLDVRILTIEIIFLE